MKAGQKPYGSTKAQKLILERIIFFRDTKIPRLSFRAIAEELNKDSRMKRGNRWSDVMVFNHYKKMKKTFLGKRDEKIK
ncbi:MAG: hypothetical protein ABSF20_01305 [Smithella sp.]|jgi:hypothetical protein